jgi:hypothetical protein
MRQSISPAHVRREGESGPSTIREEGRRREALGCSPHHTLNVRVILRHNNHWYMMYPFLNTSGDYCHIMSKYLFLQS